VWEAFAEAVEVEQLHISIIKVDCMANTDVCMNQRVQAFPTLRVFKEGQVQPPDYRSDRTVDALMEFTKSKLSLDHQIAQLDPEAQAAHHESIREQHNDHPGCQMSGFLLVNRVPGNFHIEARSKHHNLNPAMANVSHVVNHLSFGPQLSKRQLRQLETIPNDYFDISATHAMDGNVYATGALHQAHHHYIKVVTTMLEIGRNRGKNAILAYQMVQSSQMMQYQDGEIPDARFSYDLSPMAVAVEMKGKALYEFITSICALIGGTFTVVGLLSNFLNIVFKSKKL